LKILKIIFSFSVCHQFNLPSHHHRPNHSQHLANQAKQDSHDRHSVGQISENTEYDNDRKYSISGECWEKIFSPIRFVAAHFGSVSNIFFISISVFTFWLFQIRRKLPFLMLSACRVYLLRHSNTNFLFPFFFSLFLQLSQSLNSHTYTRNYMTIIIVDISI
jgi:hypothetical protein